MSQIVFYKPTITRKDMDSVLQAMVDEKIGPGDRRVEFVSKMSSLLGLHGGAAFRCYNDAIEVALRLAGVEKGGKAAISALAPAIYGFASGRMGVELDMVDIDRADGCISLEAASVSIAAGASAVILHDPYGSMAYQKDFASLGTCVIEDVTQSIGSSYGEEKAGFKGDIVICALEDDDLISAAGGAFLGVRTKALHDKLKSVGDIIGIQEKYLGLPDLNCALGLVQIDNLDDRLEKRKRIHEIFRKSLQQTDHRMFGLSNVDFDVNGGYFPVLLDSRPVDVMKFGSKYKVPIEAAFRDIVGKSLSEDFDRLPGAIPYMLRGVLFPIYPFLAKSDVETISRVIAHLP